MSKGSPARLVLGFPLYRKPPNASRMRLGSTMPMWRFTVFPTARASCASRRSCPSMSCSV